MSPQKNQTQKNVDYVIFFLVAALVAFGMMMVSSVSVYSSFRVTSKLWEPNNFFYLQRNIVHVIIGVFVLFALAKIPYAYFEKYARHIFGGSLLLLIAALIIWQEYNGAKGWISVPGIPFLLQPVEFLKVALIVYLAYFFKVRRGLLWDFVEGFVPFALLISVPVLLLALQPDFGSILIIVPIAGIMFFLAGGGAKHLISVLVAGILFAFTTYSLGSYSSDGEKNKLSYIHDRINNFLADNRSAIENKTINFQTEQGLIAIGSGGFSGRWFGKSIQKFGYLPEVQWDFVFSVIVEELGFLWAFALVIIYGALIYRAIRIGQKSDDPFARYIAYGIATWLAVQVYINMGVNLNIVPLTGVTLPFVSYGWSSLLSLMVACGMLLSISRHTVDRGAESSLRSMRSAFDAKTVLRN